MCDSSIPAKRDMEPLPDVVTGNSLMYNTNGVVEEEGTIRGKERKCYDRVSGTLEVASETYHRLIERVSVQQIHQRHDHHQGHYEQQRKREEQEREGQVLSDEGKMVMR